MVEKTGRGEDSVVAHDESRSRLFNRYLSLPFHSSPPFLQFSIRFTPYWRYADCPSAHYNFTLMLTQELKVDIRLALRGGNGSAKTHC
jgi:hypothetical protein